MTCPCLLLHAAMLTSVGCVDRRYVLSCRKLWSSVSAGKDIKQDYPGFYFERLFSLALRMVSQNLQLQTLEDETLMKKIEVCCFCLLYLFFCVLYQDPSTSWVTFAAENKGRTIWPSEKIRKNPIKSAESRMKSGFIPFAGDCHTRLCLRHGLYDVSLRKDAAGLHLHPGFHLRPFSSWREVFRRSWRKLGSCNLCCQRDISSSHNPLCFCQKLADGGRAPGSQRGDAASLAANYLSSTSCPAERDRLERWLLAADGVRLHEIAPDWPGWGLIEAEEVSSVNCGFN